MVFERNELKVMKEEKYYRRAYSLLNELTQAYQFGFDKSKALEFWKYEFAQFVNNSMVSSQKIDALMLSIVITLLGLNKEAIERKEKVKDYNELVIYKDFRELDLRPKDKQKIAEFDALKTRHTAFDNWLSIINCPNTDVSNSDVFRRVRNGLLHANFVLDMEELQTSYTHIKTKSYYEAVILNQNFYQFIFSYFSNVLGMGLNEDDRLFDVKVMNIKNLDDLVEYLRELTIIKIETDIENYDGTNTIGMMFQEKLSKNKVCLSPT